MDNWKEGYQQESTMEENVQIWKNILCFLLTDLLK